MHDQELEEKAEVLFNCEKKSILNYLIQSYGTIGATEEIRKRVAKEGIKA